MSERAAPERLAPGIEASRDVGGASAAKAAEEQHDVDPHAQLALSVELLVRLDRMEVAGAVHERTSSGPEPGVGERGNALLEKGALTGQNRIALLGDRERGHGVIDETDRGFVDETGWVSVLIADEAAAGRIGSVGAD